MPHRQVSALPISPLSTKIARSIIFVTEMGYYAVRAGAKANGSPAD
jgi:hypothetical protein